MGGTIVDDGAVASVASVFGGAEDFEGTLAETAEVGTLRFSGAGRPRGLKE